MKSFGKLKKAVLTILLAAISFGLFGSPLQKIWAADETAPAADIARGDIVILYDNDVHCAVDGYAGMSALKKEMKNKTDYVSVVSSGDFIQGATIGALSEGENIVNIMNQVGYDVVTLGNHEFDYQIKQLMFLTNKLNSDVVCCNFMNLKTNQPVYKDYILKEYGDKKVAFIGITTPEAVTKSTPAYFQNKKGKFIYGFCNDKTGKALYKRIQRSVNAARKAGADYVVALAHLGNDGVTKRWSSTSVINNTTGIDVLLDGHSHSTFAESKVKNKTGEDVIVSSTGTKFADIGELVIPQKGNITTQLVSLKEYTKTDPTVSDYIASVKKAYEAEVLKVIGKTTVELTTLNTSTKKRAVRSAETNLGDFCADALHNVLDADAAVMNGGGIRADIAKGDITYNDLLSVFPWSNMGCVIEVTGQQLKDALEMGARNYPEECGGFLQVSGITYEINSSMASSVKTDANGMFEGVSAEYRVQNIKVFNKSTGNYENIDLRKKYKLAGINYTLKNCGDGFTMFKNCKILKDEVAVDNEILITYLTKNLKGTVGNEYFEPTGQGRIVIK